MNDTRPPEALREAAVQLDALLGVTCDCGEAWTGRHLHAPDCRFMFIRDYLDDDDIAVIRAALATPAPDLTLCFEPGCTLPGHVSRVHEAALREAQD